MENKEIIAAINKIADVLDARLEEISTKLDDVTASLQNLIIDEDAEEDMDDDE